MGENSPGGAAVVDRSRRLSRALPRATVAMGKTPPIPLLPTWWRLEPISTDHCLSVSINQNQYRPCVGHRDLADNNRDWVKVVLVVSRNSVLLRGLLAQIDLDWVRRFYFAGFSLELLLCGVFVGAPMNILALVSVTAPHSIWKNKRLSRMELRAQKQSHTKSLLDCSLLFECKLNI